MDIQEPVRSWPIDRQGVSTLVAGALLLLISFITNYGDESIFQLGNFAAADKWLF